MSLAELWFVVVAVFVGFFVLEGFDFGVGALHSLPRARRGRAPAGDRGDRTGLGRQRGVADRRRRAIFAAFPDWYATWFSAGYLALMLVIVALIVRRVSFEWRTKLESGRWRRTFSAMLTIGSARCRCCSASRSVTCSPGCPSTPPASSPATSSTCSRRTAAGRRHPAGAVPGARRHVPGAEDPGWVAAAPTPSRAVPSGPRSCSRSCSPCGP